MQVVGDALEVAAAVRRGGEVLEIPSGAEEAAGGAPKRMLRRANSGMTGPMGSRKRDVKPR